MKTILPRALGFALVLVCGCSERSKETKKAKQESTSKAHAEAAKKEMQTIPEVFSTPDYYKKNEPAAKAPPSAQPQGTKK